MTPEAKQKIQLVLAVAIAVVGIRAGYIVYERYSERARRAEASRKAAPLNPDDYVVPKKLYPYDLKSAKQLTQQPVWVREGYRSPTIPTIWRATAPTSRMRLACCCPFRSWRSKMW